MRSNVLKSLTVMSLVMGLAACDSTGNDTGISVGNQDDDGGGEEEGEEEGDPSGGDETPSDSGNEAGAPNPHCANIANIADDLELGTTLIPGNGGRQGAWYTYNDATPGATQTPVPMTEPFLPTTQTAAWGFYSARTAGMGFTDWGAGFGFDLNNMACEADEEGNPLDPNCPADGIRMPYDASEYTGVSFYGRSLGGPIVVSFKVPTVAETPIAEAGTCDPATSKDGCSDSPLVAVDFDGTWKLFEVRFSELRTGGWGDQFAWDPTNVLGLQWQVGKDVYDFDIAVDEVCFF